VALSQEIEAGVPHFAPWLRCHLMKLTVTKNSALSRPQNALWRPKILVFLVLIMLEL